MTDLDGLVATACDELQVLPLARTVERRVVRAFADARHERHAVDVPVMCAVYHVAWRDLQDRERAMRRGLARRRA